MKKNLKDNIIFVITSIIIIVIVGFIWIFILSITPPDKEKMDSYFERDKSDFAIITEYFINSGYSYINIDKSNIKKSTMFTGANTYDKRIEDDAVIKSLNRLFEKQGYHVIGRNDNTVFFQKWSFLEKDRGIAYSINGKDKPVVEFLIKLETLSENGWYYYEADYNEYRK